MRRRRNEVEERRIEHLLHRLFRRSPGIAEHALRAMARTAAGKPRPPAKSFGGSRWVFSRRWTGVAVGLALVVGSGLGFGLGNSLTPNGTAAQGPVGLGFLPADGWNVLQSGTRATLDRPAYATAANVPIDPEDVVAGGLPDPSGLPYATLRTLESEGVVIVAIFTKAQRSDVYRSTRFPATKLPLRISDAAPFIQYGTQLRPEQPLGQYQLLAAVNGYEIDLNIYFGRPDPTPALLEVAQRQLDRLVVHATPPAAQTARRPAARKAASAAGIVNRTFVCAPALVGGVRQIDARAHRGSGRHGPNWDRPAFAAVSTTVSGAAATAIENELVWLAAGRPSASATVVTTMIGFTFPVRSWGTLGVNAKLCRASTARFPLVRKGLRGGATGPFDERYDCVTPRRILVRVRATLQSRTSLKGYRGFLRTTVPVREGVLVVRTESGKLLVYAEVLNSGKSFLFTAPTCNPD
jgi:hypothetical protein